MQVRFLPRVHNAQPFYKRKTMLKPKRVITKKEIERDPFLESVNKIQIHFQDRRSDYMKIALGLIVVLIGFSIVSF